MKWTNEQTKQLRAMVYEGKSNKEIADALHISDMGVSKKRSRLGITIAKMAASKPESAPAEPAATEPETSIICYCSDCITRRCGSTGSENVVVGCPYYFSKADRQMRWIRKCKKELLQAFSHPDSPFDKDEQLFLKAALNQIIPDKRQKGEMP